MVAIASPRRGVAVTGAGRGIGPAIASKRAADGARVVVNDLDAAAVKLVANELGGIAVPGDAASEDGVAVLEKSARKELGSIDIYLANAGIDTGKGLDTPEDDWAKALDVNVGEADDVRRARDCRRGGLRLRRRAHQPGP
ncbi:SDR family NAD(P)-dependent oxidoreductase [Micromonospora sp. NBC_00389]|uniref:SDR family NAD(P)-dependent oxidoreductase n=1 Tax=Micromonospora sp. NBC_00389 TaxID=2903586 RepID=UPI002E22D2DD